MDEELQTLFPIYRVWKDTGTSLNEIMYEWSTEQVMQANAVLDMYFTNELAAGEMDMREMEEAARKRK